MTQQRVVRSYLLIAGLYTLAASLIWGVNTLFLLDAGLDIFEVFIANAAFTAGMVVFEIPTGVVADTLGRRVSFLLSVAVLIVTTLLYLWLAQIEAGLVAFAIVSAFLGLGFTFYSGAVEAWLVDALAATGFDGELDRIFARGSMVSGAAMLVGSIGGGLLGTIDLAVPFVARAILLAGLFVAAYTFMHDVGFTPRTLTLSALPGEMKVVARNSIRYGWHRLSVRLFMFTSFLSFGFTVWAFYAAQPYFLELLERDAVWIAGVVTALISLSTIAGNALVEWLTRYCMTRTKILAWAVVVQGIAAVGVGVADNFWIALPLFLAVTGSMGLAGPIKQAYLHGVIPTEHRATVISFDAMFGSTGGVAGQLGLGYLSRARSLATGYVVGGIALALQLPLVLGIRRLREPADVIEGRGGKQGPCAAQGLARVGAVDSVPRQPVEV